MVKKEDKKVMIFVDGSNLFWATKRYSEKNKYKYRIDVDKFLEYLIDARDFIRAYWYVSTKTPPIIKQVNFYSQLEKRGIIVRKKPLVKGKEKGVDVALVTDLLCFGFKKCYDVAIIFSGDRDLCSAYDEIRQIGLRIEITALKGDYNPVIIKHCDKLIELDDYAESIKI